MRIVMIASEAVPYGPARGASELVGALPRALADRGHRVSVILPLLGFMRESFAAVAEVEPISVRLHDGREDAVLFRAHEEAPGVELFAIGADRYFDRPGVYGEGGEPYADSIRRFAFFCRAALGTIDALAIVPDVIQCHDWPTALVPIYLRGGILGDDRASAARDALARAAIVLSVSDLGFQGEFPSQEFAAAGVPRGVVSPGRIEADGKVNLLREGLERADAITTSSPRYAREIRAPEHGVGLDPVFEARAAVVTGILNGIDVEIWDPEADPYLVAPFSASDASAKRRCKADLLIEMDLEADLGAPVAAVLSPLVPESGMDILLPALAPLLDRGLRFVALGTGDDDIVHRLRDMAAGDRARFAFHHGESEALEHKILAGADLLVMPHVHEPCGSLQMRALRYGTVPVVRAVGGLADTVLDVFAVPDRGTGFWIEEHTEEGLGDAVERALVSYAEPAAWSAIRERGMRCDLSWSQAAARYLQLYRRLVGREPVDAVAELPIHRGFWHGRVAEDFTHERVRAVAQGLAEYLFEQDPATAMAHRGILTGYDTRLLGAEFAATAAGVLTWNDVSVVWPGAPTSLPAAACAVAAGGLAGALVVTGEATGAGWNGIHLLGPSGAPVAEAEARVVMQRGAQWLGRASGPQGLHGREAAELGLRRDSNPAAIHRDVLEAVIDTDAIRSSGLRVACDLRWGCARGTLDRLLRESGVPGDVIHEGPDPTFGGVRPEPIATGLGALAARVRDGHDLGVAIDPSGTRLGVVDSDGSVVPPDHALSLILDHLAETRGRTRRPIARSVATSRLVDAVATRRGLDVIETPTGFQEIGALLGRGDASIGIDASGFAWSEAVPHPDACLAALLLVELIAYRRRPLASQLAEIFGESGRVVSVRRRISVASDTLDEVSSRLRSPPERLAGHEVQSVSTLDGARFALSRGAWILVRPDEHASLVELAAEAETQEEGQALLEAAQDAFVLR